jgi:hypothetical protein
MRVDACVVAPRGAFPIPGLRYEERAEQRGSRGKPDLGPKRPRLKVGSYVRGSPHTPALSIQTQAVQTPTEKHPKTYYNYDRRYTCKFSSKVFTAVYTLSAGLFP